MNTFFYVTARCFKNTFSILGNGILDQYNKLIHCPTVCSLRFKSPIDITMYIVIRQYRIKTRDWIA